MRSVWKALQSNKMWLIFRGSPHVMQVGGSDLSIKKLWVRRVCPIQILDNIRRVLGFLLSGQRVVEFFTFRRIHDLFRNHSMSQLLRVIVFAHLMASEGGMGVTSLSLSRPKPASLSASSLPVIPERPGIQQKLIFIFAKLWAQFQLAKGVYSH